MFKDGRTIMQALNNCALLSDAMVYCDNDYGSREFRTAAIACNRFSTEEGTRPDGVPTVRPPGKVRIGQGDAAHPQARRRVAKWQALRFRERRLGRQGRNIVLRGSDQPGQAQHRFASIRSESYKNISYVPGFYVLPENRSR